MPCVREAATRRASPALASQAENASNIIGADEKIVAPVWNDHMAVATYRESIIASKHRRADRRCFR